MFKIMPWAALSLCLCLPALSAAQTLGAAPGTPTLSKKEIHRMIKCIPALSAAAGENSSSFMSSITGKQSAAQPSEEDMAKIQAELAKFDFDLMEFAMKMGILVATYAELEPKAYDDLFPSVEHPVVKAQLEDPKISDADKDALRMRIAEGLEAKDITAKQFKQMATQENKKVVKPHLRKIRKLFKSLQAKQLAL